eukprot:3435389-Pleurochrysis_carterae.AAC.1
MHHWRRLKGVCQTILYKFKRIAKPQTLMKWTAQKKVPTFSDFPCVHPRARKFIASSINTGQE